ncbi:MAG: amidohydrolase family protein [Chloroflexi bacterium]|nr:amidohydrolase family protein [Chloroflexota bacterium]
MSQPNRREFLAGSGALVFAQPARRMLIVDTHAHIYSGDETRYPPVAEPRRPPGASGSLGNLRRVTKENGVAGGCIVQATTFYGWDNRFICDSAAANPAWTAGVCTLDPDDAQSPRLIAEMVRKYGIRALRSYPAKDGRIDNPGVQALWTACGKLGITINVLCNRNNTGALARMLEEFGRQRVVIDHCMNLRAGRDQDAILADMLRLAKFPNAHAKLTFVTTGSAEQYPFRDMHEPCRKIIAAYSPDRCIWGSNFPNELWTPKATYAQNLAVFTQELGLGAAAQEAILGRTARGLYFQGKL